MSIKPLKWDSGFFKLKIGKIVIKNNQFKNSISDIPNFDLIYIEENNKNTFTQKNNDYFNITYTDKKIIYSKILKQATEIDKEITEYLLPVANKKLIDLSIQSGAFSRFKLDKNFNSDTYKKLYKTWIKNSVDNKSADILLIYGNSKTPKAFVSLVFKANSAQIGLIAVDKDSQNIGIGKLLISAAEHFAFKNNFTTLQVVTQAANIKACAFYEKCGFKKEAVVNTHHHWKKNVHTI